MPNLHRDRNNKIETITGERYGNILIIVTTDRIAADGAVELI